MPETAAAVCRSLADELPEPASLMLRIALLESSTDPRLSEIREQLSSFESIKVIAPSQAKLALISCDETDWEHAAYLSRFPAGSTCRVLAITMLARIAPTPQIEVNLLRQALVLANEDSGPQPLLVASTLLPTLKEVSLDSQLAVLTESFLALAKHHRTCCLRTFSELAPLCEELAGPAFCREFVEAIQSVWRAWP